MFSKQQIDAVYQARKQRLIHPVGTFDNGGRWYPSSDETSSWLNDIRSPSRAWPYSYMTACRTRGHCIRLAVEHPEHFAAVLAAAEAALARVAA